MAWSIIHTDGTLGKEEHQSKTALNNQVKEEWWSKEVLTPCRNDSQVESHG